MRQVAIDTNFKDKHYTRGEVGVNSS